MGEEVLAGVAPVLAALVDRLATGMDAELGLIEAVAGRPVPAPTAPGEPDLWHHPGAPDGEGGTWGMFVPNDRDIIQPEEYPAVLITPQGTGPSRQLDMVEGRPVRVIPYVVRITILCRHWSYDEVGAARNRLAVGCIQTLLRSAILSPTMTILPDGWRESYSEADIADSDQRSYAGWWVELTVESVEHLGDVMLAGGPGRPLAIELTVHPEADDAP